MLVAVEAPAQTNGIFADFATSMGIFTCQLDYTNSPKAVASFVGLATGQRAWLDLVTGAARTNAFYDGLTFHRVISGFMIQGGSPDGQGGDGPGYEFVDESSPALNFNNPWVLALANSGPDSNGSQFFVTVEPYPFGNNSYVIFGRVVSGTNVVSAINQVATDANDKPLTNMVLQQVSIRRVGAAAQAFDINAQGLAAVANLPIKIGLGVGQVSLTFSNRIYSDNRWYSTTNLSSWTANGLGIEVKVPTSNTVQVLSDSAEKFFRFAQVQYTTPILPPKNVLSSKLSFSLNSGGLFTVTFDATGGGTFTAPLGQSGVVTDYTWNQDPYRGLVMIGMAGGYPVLDLRCSFSTGTNGTMSGTAYPYYPIGFGSYAVAGPFSLIGP